MSYRRLISTVDLSRTEWLAYRRQGIGSSDAAAVAGLDQWRGPLRVWAEKTGMLIPDNDDPSEAAFWGRTLEPVIAQAFTAETGIKVQRANAILQSVQRPHMLANLDRVTIGDGDLVPVEIKAHSTYRRDEWADGRVPDSVAVQTHHQMLVLGKPYAWAVCLLGGQKLIIRRVDYDPVLAAQLVEIEDAFWAQVESGQMPDAVHGDDGDLLGELHPDGDPAATVTLDDTAREALAGYRLCRSEIKAYEAQKDIFAARLKRALGAAHVGKVDGRVAVKWAPATTSRVDIDALRASWPALVEAFTVTTTQRRIHVPQERSTPA